MATLHTDIEHDRDWTPLTNGAVQAVFLQNKGEEDVVVQATLADVSPATSDVGEGALTLSAGQSYFGAVSTFAAGLGTGPFYLWVKGSAPGRVAVSHGDGAGGSAGSAGGAVSQYAEDTPHVSGDQGIMVLAIRSDDDVATANDGDYTALKLDEVGRLKVAAQPASYPLVTGDIVAINGAVSCLVSRSSNVMVAMAATALVGHNATFEGSLDSTDGVNGNWFTVQAVRTNGNNIETATGVLAATPAYAWELSVNGLNWFRVRATAHTSGTAKYHIQRGTYATEPIPAAQASATQPVSITGNPVLGAGGNTIGTVNVNGQGAESAAAVGNALRVASRVRTAPDTTLAANDSVDHTATSAGQLLVKPGGLTESAWNASLALTTTVAAALAAAGGASLKRHITGLQAINTGAAVVDLIILDGATERWRMPLPINVPVSITFEATHLITTANAALNVNLSVAGTVRVNAQGYTAP